MKNIIYKVPINNKEIFADPSVDRISDLVLTNRKKILDYKFEIAGIPFRELRDKTRMELLYKAAYYTKGIDSLLQKDRQGSCLYMRNSTQKDSSWQTVQDKLCVKGRTLDYESIKNISIIQTGHEPIFYYPGVWIKNHLTQHLTKKMGGMGVNMIVDNDACNMGFMYMPGLSEKPASTQKVELVKGKYKTAYEEIVFDNIGEILQFKEEVLDLFKKNASHEEIKKTIECMQTMFEKFINYVVKCYQQDCIDMVGLLTFARRAFERAFFVDNLEIPVSWMCDMDGFYYFLLHILYEAERFTKIYNEKLAEYRRIHKIRSKANPLPDLKVVGDLIELPFWIWKAGNPRDKCFVLNENESIKVINGSNILITLKRSEEAVENISRLRTLKDEGIKIRPRAITTTMFSRVFFSDVFIHGIGGAKYDTITDEIIKGFFGVDPPAFVTISANLFLPFDTFDINLKTLQSLQHDLKDMRYNPERYASKETQNNAEFIQRVEEKQRLLRMMADCNAKDKKHYFNKIRELNKQMLNQIRVEVLEKQRAIDTTNDNLAYNEVVRFREYPICIYPMGVMQDYFLKVFSEG